MLYDCSNSKVWSSPMGHLGDELQISWKFNTPTANYFLTMVPCVRRLFLWDEI